MTGDDFPRQFDDHRVPQGNGHVIEYLDDGEPWLTLTVCVFEVLNGRVGRPGFAARAERQRFGGVQAIGFNEELAVETAQLQHEAARDDDTLSVRDAMIAATARTGRNRW
jgi:hypothetical protein